MKKKMGISVLWMFFLLLPLTSLGQDRMGRNLYCSDGDKTVFERYRQSMESRRSLPMGEMMIETARFFLETPYVASTLEKEPEGLVVNLRELDCTTYAETVLALCRTMQAKEPSFGAFCDQLQQVRYRNGTIGDYTDRLHYMVDWFYENERKGIVRDVNREIGGVSLPLEISFISTHPDSYKQLKNNPMLAHKMAEKEKEVNLRSYYYVPREEIGKLSAGIKDGDIICFVTSIKGLDVTHVGIACWVADKLTFMHASSSAKKVILNEESLRDYAFGIKTCKGILVARPL